MMPVVLALMFVAILMIVVVAGRSDEFVVSRATKISASAEKVFAYVNDLRKWDDWSPWAKLDPNCKVVFEGAAGPGSSMSWDGNKKVGAGKMTILESQVGDFVCLKLEFVRPFPGTSEVEFTFRPRGAETNVTWTMTGKNNFGSKVFGLFVDCEKMVARDYDRGLAALKRVVEGKQGDRLGVGV
ncbi:MAG TPA: SRPBCC family protein [Flavisolibacter sp.]|nr:SRPBCC family protein [Flavisolibacter sp.]